MELSLPWDPVFYSAVSMRAAANSILTRTSHDTGSSDHTGTTDYNGLSVVSLGAIDIEENGFDMEYIRWGKRKGGGERREKDVVDDRERCSVNNTIILIIKYMQY